MSVHPILPRRVRPAAVAARSFRDIILMPVTSILIGSIAGIGVNLATGDANLGWLAMLAIGLAIGVAAWAGRPGCDRPRRAHADGAGETLRSRRWLAGRNRWLAGRNRWPVALLTAATLHGAGFLGTSAPPP